MQGRRAIPLSLLNAILYVGEIDVCLGFGFLVMKKILSQTFASLCFTCALIQGLHTFSPAAAHQPFWKYESSCLVILFAGLYCLTVVSYSNTLCKVPAARLSCAGRVSVFLACTCPGAISHLPVPHAESCFLSCCGCWPGRAQVTRSM